MTICTQDRKSYFGEIQGETMILSEIGRIAESCWQAIPAHFPDAILDQFVVMPNHIHGIVIITRPTVGNENLHPNAGGVGNENFRSLRDCVTHAGNEDVRSLRDHLENRNPHPPRHGASSRSLSSIIRGFKIGVTKWCRENNHMDFAWHKSFHDRVIRDDRELGNIQRYIADNPARWATDPDNLSS